MKINWNIITFLIVLIIGSLTIINMYESIRDEVPRENNCLERELTYYRTVGGILTSSVETTKENSDYSKLKCIKWEEEPSISKVLLGQKLIE